MHPALYPVLVFVCLVLAGKLGPWFFVPAAGFALAYIVSFLRWALSS
jgi:hypothetical protein